ncbi:MAG: hypothetical protein OXR66_02655 [Candidatus Woesearchaeota archaeon]|nr:hypothetical protein [Candidatus Woesearchaeota archaeon]
MKLASHIRFYDRKTQTAFEALPTGTAEKKKLFTWIVRAFNDIENNAFCGIQVQKRLIPKEYKKYNIRNLWKYDLPNGWRLLYTIENQEVIVVSIVLEWLNHKTYEKRFKY